MTAVEMIPVPSLRGFPVEPVWVATARSLDEVKLWAQSKGAKTVWYYEHQIGNFGITAVVLAKAAQ